MVPNDTVHMVASGHRLIEETSGPSGHRFIGIIWSGITLGSFSTTNPITQPTFVVAGLPGAHPLILAGVCHGIGQREV